MNVALFVENVKIHCKTMGVSVFKACQESGAGETLMDNVKRGRIPSIDRVQLLAQYFGTTTSELLGEEKPTPVSGDGLSPLDQRLNELLEKESDETKQAMIDFLEKFRKP